MVTQFTVGLCCTTEPPRLPVHSAEGDFSQTDTSRFSTDFRRHLGSVMS